MNNKTRVFCVGLIKTGTTSLAEALTHLGYRHLAFNRMHTAYWAKRKKLLPLFNIARNYDSLSDWPWCIHYRELDSQFPGSKFILTTRIDSTTWFHSLESHANRLSPIQNVRPWTLGYKYPNENPDAHISFYEQHNQNVRNYFKDRPEDLLDVCWERGDGWKELCDFLHLPVPEIQFPKVNVS